MKKIIAAAITGFTTAVLFAGGIDNKSNLNAGYLRNASRNTEHKRPEAVLYNIAGTGFMDDGLAFTVGNQFIFKKYTDDLEMNNTEYTDDKNVFFFPDFEAVYKKDNWAVFGGFGVFAGGGSLDYKDGNAATYLALYQSVYKNLVGSYGATIADAQAKAIASNHSLDVYSVTMGEILGGAYQLNDNISISAAGRFLHSTQDMTLTCAPLASMGNGGSDLGYNAKGYGFGGIFGVNTKDLFLPGLYLSAQYQTITKMDMKFKDTTGTMTSGFGIVKDEKFHNDLPAVLSLGAGYYATEDLYFSISYNHYFNTQANMQNPLGKADLEYKDSWEVGIGCDWQVAPKVGVSGGLMYSKQGTKDDLNSAFSPVLDSFVAGCGVEYQFTKQIMGTLAYMHCRYINKDYEMSGKSMELDKDIYLASLGVTVRPFAK